MANIKSDIYNNILDILHNVIVMKFGLSYFVEYMILKTACGGG